MNMRVSQPPEMTQGFPVLPIAGMIFGGCSVRGYHMEKYDLNLGSSGQPVHQVEHFQRTTGNVYRQQDFLRLHDPTMQPRGIPE